MAVTQHLISADRKLWGAMPSTPAPAYIAVLHISSATNFTVPAGCTKIIITPATVNAWYNWNTTATVPAATKVDDGTASGVLKPVRNAPMHVTAGAVCSFIPETGTDNIVIECYA